MSKLNLINPLLSLFLLSYAGGATAQDSKKSIDKSDSYYTISHSYLTGDTTYKIGGLVCYPNNCIRTFFPFSVLEFPIDLLMVNVAGFKRNLGRFTLGIGISKSIASRTGVFRNSDYFYEPGNTRDIYSESKSNAKATIISMDLEAPWAKHPNGNRTFYGINFYARSLSFEIRDTDQVSNVPGFCTCKVSGTTIKYDISYFIPSLYIRTQTWVSDKFDLSFKLAFSPLTMVIDKDQHVVRGRTLNGLLYGESYSFEILSKVHLSKTLDLVLSVSSLLIDTEGTQTQTEPGQPNIEVDETVDSVQHSLGIALQFSL